MISLEYLAGFIDADGSLGIYWVKQNTGRIRLFPRLAIYNSYVPVLKMIKNFIIKKEWQRKLKILKSHDHVYYILIQNYDGCYKLLSSIFPYLIVKKEEAKLILKFIEATYRRDQKERIRLYYEFHNRFRLRKGRKLKHKEIPENLLPTPDFVNRSWSQDEINFLKNNFNRLTDDEIAKKIGRSKLAVQMKRLQLRLLRKRGRRRKNLLK